MGVIHLRVEVSISWTVWQSYVRANKCGARRWSVGKAPQTLFVLQWHKGHITEINSNNNVSVDGTSRHILCIRPVIQPANENTIIDKAIFFWKLLMREEAQDVAKWRSMQKRGFTFHKWKSYVRNSIKFWWMCFWWRKEGQTKKTCYFCRRREKRTTNWDFQSRRLTSWWDGVLEIALIFILWTLVHILLCCVMLCYVLVA